SVRQLDSRFTDWLQMAGQVNAPCHFPGAEDCAFLGDVLRSAGKDADAALAAACPPAAGGRDEDPAGHRREENRSPPLGIDDPLTAIEDDCRTIRHASRIDRRQ